MSYNSLKNFLMFEHRIPEFYSVSGAIPAKNQAALNSNKR